MASTPSIQQPVCGHRGQGIVVQGLSRADGGGVIYSVVTTPHFVLISDSHEGTANDEFYDRVAEDRYRELGNPWLHEAGHCEYKMHLLGVLGSNFASIATVFLGKHDQYPFELSLETEGCPDEDGHKHIVRKMVDAGFGGRALEQYWRPHTESVESGTGEHPWLYTFEHAYLELPSVVGRQVQEIVEKRVKHIPLWHIFVG